MRDVRDLLDEAVGSYRSPTLPEAVERRVRARERRRRVLAGVVALALVAAPAWLAWTALRPTPRPGSEGTATTYLLSDFEVTAHVDPVTGAVAPTEADVVFQVRWSSGEFPGVHACTVRIRDAAGEGIGSHTFELASLAETRRAHLRGLPVRGSLDGAMAEGWCSEARLDTPVAYVISDVRVGADLVVTYRVGWPDSLAEGEYPGTNACTAALWEGERLLDAHRFTLSMAEGVYEEAFTPARDLSPTAATVVCEPFVRPDVFPEPMPPGGGSGTNTYTDPLG